MMTMEKFKELIAKQSKEVNWGAASLLEKKSKESPLKPEERLTMAVLCDVLDKQYGIDDLLDEIFMDDEFEGTYFEAMEIARVMKEAN